MNRGHARRQRVRRSGHAAFGRAIAALACERLESRWLLAADDGTSPAVVTAARVDIPAELAAVRAWTASVPAEDLASGRDVSVPRSGVLVFDVAAGLQPPPGLRLTLLDAAGNLVVELATHGGERGPLLRQFLTSGNYRLRLEAEGPVGVGFVLRFQPAESPVLPIFVDHLPTCVASVDMNGKPIDFNGDGIGDLIVAGFGDTRTDPADTGGLTILEGVGDGSFHVGAFLKAGVDPQSVAVGTAARNDSPLLLVAANYTSGNVTVLRQAADRAFLAVQPPIDVGRFPTCVALRDLDGNGLTDIVVANSAFDDATGLIAGDPGSVSVLLQQVDGTFRKAVDLPAGNNPMAVAIATMNDDDLPDIVVVNNVSNDVSILLQQPGGGFREADVRPAVGLAPAGIAIADIDGDKTLDIVVANSESNDVSILFQKPASTRHEVSFRTAERFAAGIGPWSVMVADIDGDNRLDIVTANQGSNDVSVIYAVAKGVFGPGKTFSTGSYPSSVAAIVRSTGRIDLVTADSNDGTVSVLRGLGGDKVLERNRTTAGSYPYDVAVNDVDGDGRQDVVTVNYESGDVSVLLGRGDGTFAKQRRFAVGNRPERVCVADINVDGRSDIVVAASGLEDGSDGMVRVLLGLGDGTFDAPISLVGNGQGVHPVAIAVDDLDGDGLPDLVLAISDVDAPAPQTAVPASVHILFQQLDGSFEERNAALGVGANVGDIVLGDVDRDDNLDIVVSYGGGDPREVGGIFVFWGSGNGAFPVRSFWAAGNHPQALAVGDMDGDGLSDIVAANVNSPYDMEKGDISILIQSKDRRFTEQPSRLAVGVGPRAISIADFNGDPRPDIAVVNSFSKSIGVLVATDAGRFLPMNEASLGSALPTDIVAADIDADGRRDLVTANSVTNDVSVLLSTGRLDAGPTAVILNNTVPRDVGAIVSKQGTPAGTVTVDRTGVLQVRRTSANGDADTYATASGGVFAMAVMPVPDGSLSVASIDNDRRTIVISTSDASGSLLPPHILSAAPPLLEAAGGPLLSRILSADVDGNGWGDLLVSNPGAGTIDILVANPDGSFDDGMWQQIPTGAGTTGILLEDINGDQVPDLLGGNQLSGDVSLRYGVPGVYGTAGFVAARALGAEYRLRTSALPYGYGVDPYSQRGTALAPFKLTDIAVGDVTGDGRKDIVAVNAQANSFAILAGLDGGGFSAAQEHLVRVPLTPEPVVASEMIEVQNVAVGNFDADGRADIALLDQPGERILLYQSVENPEYSKPAITISLTGNLPRSIRLTDCTGAHGQPDGVLDIVVGNDYGDVLVLQGKMDGKGKATGEFVTVVRADKGIALMAADIDGDGQDDFVYGNKSLDRVTMSRTATKTSFEADQKQGVIGPSAVATVVETIGGRQMKNLVVANGGANQIMLFSRTMDVAPDVADIFLPPQRFFVGTNPSAVTVADVDRDGIPDVVVANSGSNDISVMLGVIGEDGRWTMTAGPRLTAGGTSPAGVAIGDFVTLNGRPGTDGIPDIAVTNRGSNSANILAGRGAGFFNDRVPVPLVLPPNAQPGPIVPLGNGLAIGNIRAGSITIIAVTRSGTGTDFFASRTYSSGGSSLSSLATFNSGDATFLAVGNMSGSVSLFLGRPGSLDFSLQTSFAMPGVTSLAFGSTGQLFGMSPDRESALQLFAFDGGSAAKATAASIAILGASVYYVPLRASAVALVATIVSSGTLVAGDDDAKPVVPTGENKGGGDGTDGGSDESEANADANASKGPSPNDAAEVEFTEDPAAAALLKLFLDIGKTLKANNGRLLETLLQGHPDESSGPGPDAPTPLVPPGDASFTVPPTSSPGRLAIWSHWAAIAGDRGMPDTGCGGVVNTGHGEAHDPRKHSDRLPFAWMLAPPLALLPIPQKAVSTGTHSRRKRAALSSRRRLF